VAVAETRGRNEPGCCHCSSLQLYLPQMQQDSAIPVCYKQLNFNDKKTKYTLAHILQIAI
jgi:hypothetical protein